MGTINAAWHKENRMPKNPSLEQKIAWHLAHMKHCSCRAPHGKILTELQKRKLI
jgi:hypothetical protein